MDQERIDSIVEELEEYLPHSLQSKLNELVETIRIKQINPNQPIEGLILTEMKTNSWGQIVFSGFCSQIKGDAADFIKTVWRSNMGNVTKWTRSA